MFAPDGQLAELTAAAIADQASVCKQVNDRVDQGDRAEDDQTCNHLIKTEQDHGHHRRQYDNRHSRDLWKILPHKQFAASADWAASQITPVIDRLIPIQVNLGRSLRRPHYAGAPCI